MPQAILAIISGLLILAGTAGAVLPILPGIPLALGGLLLYAFVTKLSVIGWWGIGVFSLLTILTVVVDILAPVLGAKGYKATNWGTLGAVIGAFLGIFVLGPLGILFGPFIGAFIGEMLSHANRERAFKAAWGAFLGFIIGSVFKVIVGLSMFVYFLVALLRA